MTNSHLIFPHQALSFIEPSLKWPYCLSLYTVLIRVLRCQQQKQTLATLDTKGMYEKISIASRISGSAGEPSLELHSQSCTPKSRHLWKPGVTWSNRVQSTTKGVEDNTRGLRARVWQPKPEMKWVWTKAVVIEMEWADRFKKLLEGQTGNTCRPLWCRWGSRAF